MNDHELRIWAEQRRLRKQALDARADALREDTKAFDAALARAGGNLDARCIDFCDQAMAARRDIEGELP